MDCKQISRSGSDRASRFVGEWRVASWSVLLLLAGMWAGCSSSQPEPPRAPQRPGDAAIVPKRPIPKEYYATEVDGSPVEFGSETYSNGTSTHYADGSPTYMPDGSPIDYRPRNLTRDLYVIPTVFLKEPSWEQVLLPGELDNPRQDPESGAYCWRAYECKNPSCAGRPKDGGPNLFPSRPSGLPMPFLPPDSDFVAAAESEEPSDEAVPPSDIGENEVRVWAAYCPKCGQFQPHLYEPAEVASQRKQILDDIERISIEQQANMPNRRKPRD